jgi:AcrR family transcriptional regulator
VTGHPASPRPGRARHRPPETTPTDTPLRRHLLTGPRPARPTPLDAFELATRQFNSGQRIEIQALAAGLGVSRITLHRWVGTREQLLSEIMWSLTDRAIDRELDQLKTGTTSASRVPELMAQLAARVVTNRGVQRMQADELELLTRLTTRAASPFQSRLIARVVSILDEDRVAGRLHVPISSADLAFAAVRLTETFVHTPAITGEPAAPERVGPILHALLDR